MKTTIILLAAIIISITTNAQEAFTGISLKEDHNRETLAFSVPKEVNVRHYRIEASNDNVDFEVIATIRSKGNSVLAVNYKQDITAYDYTYYRVAVVNMSGEMPYSAVVTKLTPAKENIEEAVPQLPVNTGSGLAANK